MNSTIQSMISHLSDVSRLSMRDHEDTAPPELYGFVYDIPKDANLTNKLLTEIFKDHHIECNAQIQRNEKKPFYTAKVKFMSGVHLKVASENLRYFKLTKADGNDRVARFLPYVPNLTKQLDTSILQKSALKNPELTSASQNQTHFFEDEQSENMPDNSHMQCNLCVTGLDESMTGDDLHVIFKKYGEIKSAKVAIDHQTSKSKCYGYVWFMSEESCKNAIVDSANYQ